MIAALWAASAGAGTWVRAPGHGYVQLSLGHTRADHRLTESGQRLPMTDPAFVPSNFEDVFEDAGFSQVEAALYAELGLVPGLELFGSLPHRWVRSRWELALGSDRIVQRHAGLGDAVVGGRWGRAVGPTVAALAAGVRLPLYDNAPEILGIEAGNADPYDDRPPLGPGTVDLDLSSAIGVSGANAWGQLEAGVRLHDRQLGAQLPVRLQAGGRPVPWLAGFADLELLWAIADGQAPDSYLDAYGKGPLVLDRQSSVRPGLGALLQPIQGEDPGPVGLLTRIDAVLAGRRVAATTSWTGALFVTW
ncbi:MAG TPA: hypothetical protein ENK18_28090 [Deltaproteobacteria bacterium]|nr:hypothetical protein [Deltaproteobacteria bacterium]